MPFRLLASAIVLVALCAIAGCTPSTPDTLPSGTRVTVHQNRPDTEDRRLQVRISNGTNTPLTITDLTFSSPRFTGPMTYAKAPTVVRAGGVVDLPVSLGEPVCDAADGAALVQLRYTRADGVSGSAVVTPGDPLQQLDGISQLDCLEQAIARIADIRQPDAIRTELVGGHLIALVDLAIVPTAGPGSFTLQAVDDTVLFGIFDGASAAPLTSLPVGLEVHGDDTTRVITIPLVPARCDPHAVAEDKRGTLLPLRVQVDGVAGIRYFALSDELKGELYSYVAAACGQPAAPPG